MRRRRKALAPKEGERVVIHKAYPEVHSVTGAVTDVLSSQFCIADEAGQIHFCFYSDEWEYPTEDALCLETQ